MNQFNLDYIDSMRGIAILMVLTVHSTMFFGLFNLTGLPYKFDIILSSGKYGVALFFIVSAYTLFRSLDIRKEKGYKNYFIRRFLRIVPLYYVVIVFLFIFTNGISYYMQDEINDITFFNLFSHMLFINGFFINNFNSIIGTEWSVFVEVFFYITLPLLFLIRKFLIILFIVAVYISHHNDYFVGLFTDNTSLGSIQLFFSPITWYYTFIMGGIIYIYGKNEKIRYFILQNYKAGLLMVIFLYIYVMYSEIKIPFVEHLFISFLLGIFFLINKYKKVSLFNNFILKKIGELSFSLYLLHMPFFIFAKSFGVKYFTLFENQLLNYIIFLSMLMAFVFLLSMLTYKFIEQPFIELGKNYIKRGVK